MKKVILGLTLSLLISVQMVAQSKQTIQKITKFLQNREIELVKKTGSSVQYEKEQRGKRKFVLREVDLNGDKKKDYFIFFNSDCGNGGCPALILDDKLQIKASFTLVELPVIAKSQKVNGWKVLNIASNGMRKVVYNNKTKQYTAKGVANEKLVSKQYKKEKGDLVIINTSTTPWSQIASYTY